MGHNSNITDRHSLRRELICIEYPGVVVNTERMLETLGGLRDISSTFVQEKRRLELRFRPDCIYAKPVYGDATPSTALVLKLVVRRKKSRPEEQAIKSVHIVGSVRKMYKFDTMCDFQQLPAFRTKDTGKVVCVYDDIVPKGTCTFDPFEDRAETPYFLPPACFSRSDTINKNIMREYKTDKQEGGSSKRSKPRQKHGIYHMFTMTDPIPTNPTQLCEEMIANRTIAKKDFETIRDAFEKRPIWTKHALKNIENFDVSNDMVSAILPAVAFFYVNGPWRCTWVRYGYDPRKNFEARMYQMLDFRVRSNNALHDSINIKRNSQPKTNYRSGFSMASREDLAYKSSIFNEDTIPPYRIIFYQYCDIHLKKIKEMLSKVPTPMSGTVCDERNGWLPDRFDDQCRNIMTEVIINNIRKRSADASSSIGDNESTYGEEEDTSDNEQDSDMEGSATLSDYVINE